MNVENELDIRGLFRALWAGKGWIVGGAVLFAAIVLVYTFFARRGGAPRRSPIGLLSTCWGYYSQQQFLRNLDIKADTASVDQPSAMDEAYKEFIMQLASGTPGVISGCKRTTTSSASRVMLAPMRRCWMI